MANSSRLAIEFLNTIYDEPWWRFKLTKLTFGIVILVCTGLLTGAGYVLWHRTANRSSAEGILIGDRGAILRFKLSTKQSELPVMDLTVTNTSDTLVAICDRLPSLEITAWITPKI